MYLFPLCTQKDIFSMKKVGVQYNNRIGENSGYIPDIY